MEREDDDEYDGMDEGEDDEDEDYQPAVSLFCIFKSCFAITSKISRIPAEHVELKSSPDLKLEIHVLLEFLVFCK